MSKEENTLRQEVEKYYQDAKETVIHMGYAGTSLLQRRLRIDYLTACALMDELEKKGVIGPMNGVKPREVLIKTK